MSNWNGSALTRTGWPAITSRLPATTSASTSPPKSNRGDSYDRMLVYREIHAEASCTCVPGRCWRASNPVTHDPLETDMTDFQPGVISLLVPSRGRPDGCRAMWLSALDTAADPLALQLVLYLDDDDPTLPAYQQWIYASDHLRIRVVTGNRIVLSETWNRCWAVAEGELLWFGNDDIRFHTDRWDDAVRQAFEQVPDRIVVVHGRDGIH